MTGSPLFREFESGDGLFFKLLRFIVLIGGIALLGFTGTLELTWPQQIVLGILIVATVICSTEAPAPTSLRSPSCWSPCSPPTVTAIGRFATTTKFFLDPGSVWTFLDAFFIALLLFAETYAFITLFLGYLQTLWPLRRTPVPLPDDPAQWPAVDLLIPHLQRASQRC